MIWVDINNGNRLNRQCEAGSVFKNAAVKDLPDLLNTQCTVKLVAQIGEGDQEHEAVKLNRVVRYVLWDADGQTAMGLELHQRSHPDGVWD